MRIPIDRWATAAAVALALAIAPGALRLIATSAPATERAPAAFEALSASAPTGSEMAIVPPGDLTGEVAAPTSPAPTFSAATAPVAGEVYALLVGIDDYPGGASDLRSAVADVDIIDAALAGFGVPAGHRVVLRDGQATRAGVVAAVRSLVAQGGPGATYVLGYAGHIRKLAPGAEALVLADGQLLRDRDLATLLAPAAPRRMWLLMAGCFGGGFTELLAPGRVLTAAAGANELAWEDPALNASYLIHHLVREGWLEGAAGDSVQEAFAYADATLARERPNRRPVQVDQAGGELVLGHGDPTTAVGLAPAKPAPAPPRRPAAGAAPVPSTTTTSRPEDDEPCLLGLLC